MVSYSYMISFGQSQMSKWSIARIAKAASHKHTWKCLSCPVLSCPVLTTMTTMFTMTTMTTTTTMTAMTMMAMATMRKLEVGHNESGGCLISYNLQLACVRKLEVIKCERIAASIALNDEWGINESPTNVGIKLLWQLKRQDLSLLQSHLLTKHMQNMQC